MNLTLPPPSAFLQPKLLPVIEKTKSAYALWIPIRRSMPRTEQFGIGERIDTQFLTLLDILRRASFASLENKIALLNNAVGTTDSLRFFLQIGWENTLLRLNQYVPLAHEIEEIGRMIGGWRKGLLAKNPPKGGGERKE